MAVDKLVDSTQLDADLTSVANAIRTKGGTSADLAFPVGFISAVEAIPTGGGTWQGLRAEIGSFTPDRDLSWSDCKTTAIPHTLGVVPGFIMVWTHQYDDDWEEGIMPSSSNILNFWIDKDGLLPFYQISNSGDGNIKPYGGYFRQQSSKLISVYNPTHLNSTAVVNKPTDKVFYIPSFQNYGTYDAGVEYKYFLAEKGW